MKLIQFWIKGLGLTVTGVAIGMFCAKFVWLVVVKGWKGWKGKKTVFPVGCWGGLAYTGPSNGTKFLYCILAWRRSSNYMI